MATIHYVSTASFCVENARELGIPAALLLDKIVRLSNHTRREDGFCWYTAKQFEEETSLKKDAFKTAADKLVKAGLVERKVTYIAGTMDKATHFRLLADTENDQNPTSEVRSDRTSTSTAKPTFRQYDEDTIKHTHAGTNPISDQDPSFSSLSACGDSRPANGAGRVVKITTVDSADKILSNAEKAEYNEKTGELTVDVKVNPFAGTVADVKPKSKAGMVTPKAFSLAKELMGIINPLEKDTVSVARNVKSLLVKGYTEEDLRLVARLSRSDNYYHDKPSMVVLSAKGVADLLASQKKKEDDNPYGLTKEARAWI